MWLKQKVYTLRITRAAASEDDSFESIIVKINERKTTIKLSQLFAKISKIEYSDDGNLLTVKGWSILQDVVNGKLKIGEDEIDISFESEDLGSLAIELIENPWFILSDIELSDSDVENINNKLMELSGIHSGADEAEGSGLPHTSPSVIVNEKYERGRKNYEAVGFKEYKFDNFRFLLRAEKDKAILVELIDENKLIQFSDGKKVIDGFYKFEDKDSNRIIDVKLIGDDLDITFSDLEVDETNKEVNEVQNDTLTNN